MCAVLLLLLLLLLGVCCCYFLWCDMVSCCCYCYNAGSSADGRVYVCFVCLLLFVSCCWWCFGAWVLFVVVLARGIVVVVVIVDGALEIYLQNIVGYILQTLIRDKQVEITMCYGDT
jgi:hypothetical protein